MQDKIYKKAATQVVTALYKAHILNTYNLSPLQSGLF